MRSSRKQDYILLSQILLGLLCIYLVFRPDNQIIKIGKPKTYIKNIHQKEKRIEHTERTLVPNLKQIDILNAQVDGLMDEVNRLRMLRDTVKLVPMQDTLIEALYKDNKIKDTVIGKYQLIVSDLKEISRNKDTLLAIKDNKIVKLRRQRNTFILATGVSTGMLILTNLK